MHAMTAVVHTPSPPPARGGVSFPPQDRRFIHGGSAARPVVNSRDQPTPSRMNSPRMIGAVARVIVTAVSRAL